MFNLKQFLNTTSRFMLILEQNGIITPKDFFEYFPRTYEDRGNIKFIKDLQYNTKSTQIVKGTIINKSVLPRGNKKLYEIVFEDENGDIGYAIFFNTYYTFKSVELNKTYLIIGKPEYKFGKTQFSHPDFKETGQIEKKQINQKKSEIVRENKINNIEMIIKDILNMSVFIYKKYKNSLTEKQYQKLLEVKLNSLGYKTDREKLLNIKEDGIYIGSRFIDLVVENKIILELKNTSEIKKEHFTQTRAYLDRTNFKIAFIINFGGTKIQIIRLEKDYKKEFFGEFELSNLSEPLSDSSVIDSKIQKSNIYPIYSELMGIKPSRFAKKIFQNLDKIPQYFTEYLPQIFLTKYNLPDVITTIKNMHYPQSLSEQKKAVRRVFFDRILRIQIHSILNKENYKKTSKKDFFGNPDWLIVKKFSDKLPFELTKAQKKVVKQIIEDFHSGQTMMRLLQGDVGSGKTIVAVIAIWYILQKFGGQIAFLVPLSVLAKQHFISISKLLLPLGIHTELLSGELSGKQKEEVKYKLKTGQIQVVIGTHAIIQKDVIFQDLKFVIIDEQHKFGVSQRGFLKKNHNPHILQMSATPIPRSMALAFFGEFDISIIDEMPVGRKEIITKIVSQKDWKKLQPRILQKIKNGQKLFVVAPLIEESEKMEEVQSATESFFEMQNLFPNIKNKIGLLHGRMSPKEKNEIMNNFKNGKIMILVSTTVIEVGVDIPEATMMIIKNAERFGLSQLHQLRGRIGRNNLQSYCFLETTKKNGDTYKRLKAMEETNDGFKLAELDLQYRGSGEILGHKQSGEGDIPFEILSDINFLEEIQTASKELLEQYPNLEGLPLLKDFVFEKAGKILV